jgi:autotransporter-associated beta strand protein
MKCRCKLYRAVTVTLFGMCGLLPTTARAVDVVSFTAGSAGSTKSIGTWGVEVVDGSTANMLQSIASMGANNINLIATNFFVDQPLQSNGQIGTTDQANISYQLGVAALAGNKPLIIGPNVGDTDSSYLSGSGVNESQWVKLLDATKAYYTSQGWNVADVLPFNEPDYWSGQGSTTNLYDIMKDLQSDSNYSGVGLEGASTLNSDNASSWYSAISSVASQGTSHLLGGSLTSYINFIQSVDSSGGSFSNPEMHSLGEAIVGANYGQAQGLWWGPALQARGVFVQASAGKQIAYGQNLSTQSAAAVYRAPTGYLYAFAGGLERFGAADSYRFNSDRNAYFNGIGPMQSYTLQTDYDGDTAISSNDFTSFGAWFSQGAYANIDFGSPSVPALSGYRWEIKNVQTGQVLGVSGSGTSNGAAINTETTTGALNQLWNVTRTQNGYIELFNANSGLTVGVNGASFSSGASVVQWQSTGTEDQQWYLASAGNGNFYILDGNSGLYLTGSSTNCLQNTPSGSNVQKWQFVSANPTSPSIANYKFAGNAQDSTGTYNATVNGTATYSTGPTTNSQALNFDGTSTYVSLPVGVSNSSSAITVDTWVKWTGGNAWQRIFDFGNGTSSYMYLTPDSAAGTMRFAITIDGTSEEEDVDAAELPIGQWENLALTLGGQTATLYLNGRPVAAGQVLFNPSQLNATNDYLGKSQFSGDPLFSGSISGFQIYNYALAQSQIDDLVNNNLTWVGGQNANAWDASTTTNFKLASNGSSTVFTQGDRVTFDGTGTSSVVITGTVSPFSVTVTGSSNVTLSGSGSISGSQTPLTMSGTGTLTIANTGGNSYTGDTTINSGTISIAADNALGTDAANLTLNGGTLQTTSTNAMIFGHSIMVSPAGGNLKIIGNGSSTTGQADRVIFTSSNMLVGSGTLTVTGDGTLAGAAPNTTTTGAGALVLNAANSFTGTLNLQNGGLLEFATNDALDPSAAINIGNEGELAASNGATVGNALTISGGTNNTLSFTNAAGTFSGPITLNSNLTVGLRNWYNYASVESGTISGIISGSGGLTVNSGTGSGGTLTLGNFNTYIGGTTVNGSTLVISDGGSIGGIRGTLNVNAGATVKLTAIDALGWGTGTAVTQININGGTLDNAVNGNNSYLASWNLTGGTMSASGGGAFNIIGTIGSTANGSIATNASAATSTISANVEIRGANSVLHINVADGSAATDLLISGSILNSAYEAGSNGIEKDGAGVMQLTGTNTYTGSTNVSAGTLTVGGSISGSSNITTAAGATLNASGASNAGLSTTTALTDNGTTNIGANAGTGIRAVRMASVNIGATGQLNVVSSSLQTNRSVLVTGMFTETGNGTLDLGANDMIVSNAGAMGLTNVTNEIKSGFANGLWTGAGIQSSAAAGDSTHLTALGVILNNNTYGSAKPFDTITPGANDVLIKYTYYGDADLSGHVDGTDYSLIDSGYGGAGTGWQYGDFNYDGVIDGSDYSLIDNTFNQQSSAGYAVQIATQTSEIALVSTTVPEPGSLGLLAFGAFAVASLAGRTKRRLSVL